MSSLFSKRTCLAVLLSILSILIYSEWAPAQQETPGSWCVLQRRNVYEPPNCFEFFLCDTIKDVQRCGLAGGGGCGVGPLGLREGWQVDSNAHPQNNPGPYVTWQGADYAMSVLSRFGGDWYQCLGPRRAELPQRIVVREGQSEPGFCVLRKPIPQWPPNCFEFYLAVAGSGRAVIQQGVCFVTAFAARENWIIDPTMGGPYFQRGQAQAAHDRLHRFAGNFYNCPVGGTPPPPPPPDGGGGTPREQGTFSGGLDPAVVQPKVDDRRQRGYTATFKSGPVTLIISQDGRAAITRNVVFEGSLRNTKGEVSTYRKTHTLYDGTGRNGSYSGKMTWFSEDYWSVLAPGKQWKRFPPAEGTWTASRQNDGSYHLDLPNGVAGVYADIPYRLK
jgi:hypothetical protein